ncbi:MAG: Mur ligase family protein [Acidimicrobiales bacterium]|nr:Mur ligase family protein [Acidimicrobiales bacterium]
MNLAEILRAYRPYLDGELGVIGAVEEIEINGLSFDSRKVKSGNLFFCLSGGIHDGHDYALQAEKNGAAAVVVERQIAVSVPQIVVQNTRETMGYISCIYFDFPSKEIEVIGITGTNGKTTTTQLVSKILNTAGVPSRTIGTLTGALTTPEAPDLQGQFRSLANAGIKSVVMEVSSHALAQDRVTGTEFDIGVFTNLSHDHLDFHSDI